jgi:signal transduction histidine kinase/CheY-like chemotaxis protein
MAYASSDAILLQGALAADAVLPPDLHGRSQGPDAVTPREDQANMEALNRLMESGQLEYVYTLVLDGADVRFVSSSATEEDIRTGETSPYWSTYDEAPSELVDVLTRGQRPMHAEYEDRWGRHRSVFVPRRLPDGRRYAAAADISLANLDELVAKRRRTAGLYWLGYFLTGAFFFSIAWIVIRRLSNAVDANAVLARRADELARARTLFLADMSHEIRTPLFGLLGSVDLLVSGSPTAEQKPLLEVARSSGQHLRTLLDNILDLEKLEAGALAFDSRPCDLAALSREVLEMTRANLLPSDGSEWAIVDGTRVRQILLNLLSNAAKFTANGTVTLAVERVDDRRVRFAVVDTGLGMAPGVVERLFRRFQQADATVARRYGGTGLGLAITAGLAEGMGGRVDVRSRVGLGTTFSVELEAPRCAPVDAPPSFAELPPVSASSSPAAPLPTPWRVLVVDDSAVNRTVCTALLRQLGVEAEAAEGGAEALAKLAGCAFDLVLTDLHMPGMSGIELTREIRRRGGAVRLPVVAFSAATMPEEKADASEAGMDAFLPKPATREDLRRLLKKLLTRPS